MALPITVVGSWWPYDDHTDELARARREDPTGDAARKITDIWATRAIREQREFGFAEWTSGEYFVENFVATLPRYLTGLTVDAAPPFEEYDYDDFGHLTIDGPIAAPGGLGYAAAYEHDRTLPGGVTKATVVTPFEIMVPALLDQQDAIDRAMPDLLAIVNTELRRLAAAGCPHVQLDAPIIATLVNEGRMTAEAGAGLIAACFDGVEGTTRGVHFCNGNNKGRPISSVLRLAPWVPILQRLDGVVDDALLEATYWSEWAEREALKDVPRSIALTVGLVDEADYSPMPVWKIRAAGWAEVVGEDRLRLSMSCGFGRHGAADRALLEQKVTNLAEAAAGF
ncbi:hypothetical protein [Actinomycetospora aeridis]|uniref:Methionine synthase n=1 Tax=Actinomycetospora aeridis TaxID=3129231 RepID=A0ABU8NDY3_9PSEU